MEFWKSFHPALFLPIQMPLWGPDPEPGRCPALTTVAMMTPTPRIIMPMPTGASTRVKKRTEPIKSRRIPATSHDQLRVPEVEFSEGSFIVIQGLLIFRFPLPKWMD